MKGGTFMDSPQVLDYRRFLLRYLNSPTYSHVKLLFFWPLFVLPFA